MKERILEFLKIENRSSAQFAEEIGVQPSSISHIISGRNNPSLDFIMKMLGKYPALSTDWLLFGKGQMYRESQLQDLFSTEKQETIDLQDELPRNKKINYDSSLNNPGDLVPGSLTQQKSGPPSKKIARIVCFFNDNTFKEYFQGED